MNKKEIYLELERERKRLSREKAKNQKPRVVQVIPDLHAPFIKKGFLDFCLGIKDKYNPTDIVFLGDIIDNHYSSYHETDPDGHSAAQELAKAKEEVLKWYKHFPVAKVCIGNHDSIPDRKIFSAGLSHAWLKSLNEILEVPNWEFSHSFIIDGNKYCHGTSKKAAHRSKRDLISIIQGHYHSESYIEWFVGENYKIFAMQLGAGIDRQAYSMSYGKEFGKPHINCGIILDNGTLPIIEYMKL